MRNEQDRMALRRGLQVPFQRRCRIALHALAEHIALAQPGLRVGAAKVTGAGVRAVIPGDSRD